MSKKDKKTKPAVEEDAVEAAPLEDEVAEAEPGIDELKAQLQRLGADYQNYQKRSHRQIEQTREFAQEHLIQALLPVLDNFEHTLEKGGESQDVAALLQGVQIVFDHMRNVLEGAGMRRIQVDAGQQFDPNLHQAMLQQETDEHPEQSILLELATGYEMNGRTLRPAKVSVAKALQVEAENQGDQESEDADV